MEGEEVPCHSQGKQSRIHKKVLNIFLFDAESKGAFKARGKRRGEFMKLSDVQDSNVGAKWDIMSHAGVRQ